MGGEEQKGSWEDIRGLQGMWGGEHRQDVGEAKLFRVMGAGKENFFLEVFLSVKKGESASDKAGEVKDKHRKWRSGRIR